MNKSDTKSVMPVWETAIERSTLHKIKTKLQTTTTAFLLLALLVMAMFHALHSSSFSPEVSGHKTDQRQLMSMANKDPVPILQAYRAGMNEMPGNDASIKFVSWEFQFLPHVDEAALQRDAFMAENGKLKKEFEKKYKRITNDDKRTAASISKMQYILVIVGSTSAQTLAINGEETVVLSVQGSDKFGVTLPQTLNEKELRAQAESFLGHVVDAGSKAFGNKTPVPIMLCSSIGRGLPEFTKRGKRRNSKSNDAALLIGSKFWPQSDAAKVIGAIMDSAGIIGEPQDERRRSAKLWIVPEFAVDWAPQVLEEQMKNPKGADWVCEVDIGGGAKPSAACKKKAGQPGTAAVKGEYTKELDMKTGSVNALFDNCITCKECSNCGPEIAEKIKDRVVEVVKNALEKSGALGASPSVLIHIDQTGKMRMLFETIKT